MLHDDRTATRLGFAVIVLAIGAAILVTQSDGLKLARTLRVTVYFGHNAGLARSADVQVAGRAVGRIDGIRLTGKDDPADVGVAMTLEIESRYQHMVPFNGEWFVNSKGLFGERYLEVGPPRDNAPWERTIRSGDRVRGVRIVGEGAP